MPQSLPVYRRPVYHRAETALSVALLLLLATGIAHAETYGATTPNEHQVAYALSTLDPADTAGSKLGNALYALQNSGSGAASRAGLRSLGGAGLSGVPKALAEDSSSHLQTLRSSLRSLRAGYKRHTEPAPDAIPGLSSGSLSAAWTGGSGHINGSGDTGDYTRNSMGFIFTSLSPLNKDWSFGCSFAYSSSQTTCSATTIDADAYYSDFAILYNRGRLHQIATMGAGIIGVDTTRQINLPGQGPWSTAKGSTSSTAVTLSYEISYDLVRSNESRHVIAPVALAEAVFAQFKDMFEQGAGNAGLHSSWDNLQCLTVGTGFRYMYRFEHNNQPGHVSMDVLTLATSGDDTMTVTNQFLGGGASFELWGPKAGGSALRLNAAAFLPLSENWALLGNVSAEFRSHQSSVGGAAGAVYSF